MAQVVVVNSACATGGSIQGASAPNVRLGESVVRVGKKPKPISPPLLPPDKGSGSNQIQVLSVEMEPISRLQTCQQPASTQAVLGGAQLQCR